MPKPVRRRISQAEINRELSSPVFATCTRTQRRAVVAMLRVLGDAPPYRGE